MKVTQSSCRTFLLPGISFGLLSLSFQVRFSIDVKKTYKSGTVLYVKSASTLQSRLLEINTDFELQQHLCMSAVTWR